MSGRRDRRPSGVKASVPGASTADNGQLPQQAVRFATISRVLGFGANRVPSSPRSSLDSNDSGHARPRLSSSNATLRHDTRHEITSLTISEGGTHALIAGRNIFRTVRVTSDSCSDETDILAAIRDYHAAFGDGAASTRDVQHIQDVAWTKGSTGGTFVAAATFNGPILLYDMTRLGVEISRMPDHRRQVHRVSFNPHNGDLMLSASQDGTVKLWDIRQAQRSVSTVTSARESTPSQSEGIRDVKWSPTKGTEFALCTDRGWIQKWDTQKIRAPIRNIAAHASMCATIDWHPDGKHLLSAGADKMVRIWNMAAETKRLKPSYEIRTPYPLRIARWRPSFGSILHGDADVRQCTQFVASYDSHNPVIHIWDVRRHRLPFRELDCAGRSPSGVLWHSQDLLWTVDRGGTFRQSDIIYARKTIDKRAVQAFATSPQGEINVFTQTRRPRSELPQMRPEQQPSKAARRSTSPPVRQSMPQRMVRTGRDDTLDDNFLSASLMSVSDQTSEKGRSGSETPPSSYKSHDGILALDTEMQRFRPVRPNQSAARGQLPGHCQHEIVAYLAQKYNLRPYNYPPTVRKLQNVAAAFERNADHARLASMYRLAQSWRILGRIVTADLTERAVSARAARVLGDKSTPQLSGRETIAQMVKVSLVAYQASAPPTPQVKAHLSSVAATPRALAAGAPLMGNGNGGHPPLPDIDSDMAHMQLPPLVFQPELDRSRSLPDELKSNSHSRRVARSFNRSRSRTPGPRALSQRSSSSHTDDLRNRPERPPSPRKTDSNESFGVFPPLSFSSAPEFPDSMASSTSDLQMQVKENLKSPDMTQTRSDSTSSTFLRLLPDDQARTDRSRSPANTVGLEHTQSPIEGAMDMPQPRRSQGEIANDIRMLVQNNQASFTSDIDSDLQNGTNAEQDSSGKTLRASLGSSGHTGSANTSRVVQPNSEDQESYKQGILGQKSKPPRDPTQEDFIVQDFVGNHARKHPQESTRIFGLLEVLNQMISYHVTNLCDAQSLSAMLLLLMPLLAEDNPALEPITERVVMHYVDHLGSLQLSDAHITAIISDGTAHMLLAGLNPLQIEAILQTYHDQLVAQMLYVDAALLRRLCYPTFPSIYEANLKDNSVSLRCSTCGKALPSLSAARHACPFCVTSSPSCPVCWLQDSPYEVHKRKKSTGGDLSRVEVLPVDRDHKSDRSTSAMTRSDQYTTCLYCGHNAHTACLAVWHGLDAPASVSTSSRAQVNLDPTADRYVSEDNLGSCPTDGCLCYCISRRLPAARPAMARTNSESGAPLRRLQRAPSQAIVDDEQTVAESRAVLAARMSLRRSMGAASRGSTGSVANAGIAASGQGRSSIDIAK